MQAKSGMTIKIKKLNTQKVAAPILFVAVMALIGLIGIAISRAGTPATSVEAENGMISGNAVAINDTNASSGKAVKFGSGSGSSCVVTAELVNPCRPWLGAAVSGYSASDTTQQEFLGAEQRLGRHLDVVHTYHPVGSNQLSSTDIYFATRPNTILMTNWKPAASWASAGGNNSSVNATIDQMAHSIKAIAPHKILLAIYHEPENDVSGGASSCPSNIYKGSAGTPADYRAMWANVENRFTADGVTNVVWVMNYMSFSKWYCMEKDLWPGNNLVDWIVYDPYFHGGQTVADSGVGAFYNWLAANSDSTHDFLSKPWGLNEWGVMGSLSDAQDEAIWSEMKTALNNNTYPNLKMYNYFDELLGIGNANDFRVDCVANSQEPCTIDQAKENAYNAFANDPHISGSFTGLP